MRINNKTRLLFIVSYSLLAACETTNTKGTLASLNDVKFEVKEEKVDSSLEKAMESYQKFLDETPETEMTPEALRRLADLKIQKEYNNNDVDAELQQADAKSAAALSGQPASGNAATGVQNDGVTPVANSAAQATDINAPDTSFVPLTVEKDKQSIATQGGPIADLSESEKAFSERAGKKIDLGTSKQEKIVPPGKDAKDSEDLQAAGAREAIELYKGLLKKYPLFERNDQVLYQLSRAYEETGQIDIAMQTLEQLITKTTLQCRIL